MMIRLIAFTAALVLAVCSNLPTAYAASGKACFHACKTRLQNAGTWNQYPRGYCRAQCNFYVGAPPDVLKKAGHARRR